MRGEHGSKRLVASRSEQTRRAYIPQMTCRFVFKAPHFIEAYASSVRGQRRMISSRCVVKHSAVYGKNESLTSESIMMHTRPPFARKGLISLGGGVIVDKLWITGWDAFRGILPAKIRWSASGF